MGTGVPPRGPFRSTALAVAAITLLGVYAKSSEKHGDKEWTAIAHRGAIGCLAFAQAVPVIATGGDDATVKVWDARSGRLQRSLQGHTAPVSSLAFSPDDRLLASGSFDRSVKLWETGSGKLVATLGSHPRGQVKGLSFSPDGETVASAAADGVRLWEVKTGVLLGLLPSDQGVLVVAFAPNGRVLAAGGGKAIRLWDPVHRRLLRSLHETNEEIFLAVSFSADSRLLAAAGNGRTIRLWQVETGELTREMPGHPDFVRSLAFSLDGRTLISADRSTARAWNVQTGRVLGEWRGGAEAALAVALSAQHSYWAVGGSDGTLRTRKLVSEQ